MIINEVVFNVDLATVLEELQHQLSMNNIPLLQKVKDAGNNIMVQCPYHGNGQEHRPSAGIHKDTGAFHCFACGEIHSLPEVISHCFGYHDDFLGTNGWTWLIKNFATLSVGERDDIKLDFIRNTNSRSNSSNLDGTIIASTADTVDGISYNKRNGKTVEIEEELASYRYYHPYMYKRKLTDDIIEKFDIGYDVKTDCITFPVRNIYGEVLFIARRSVKTKYFNYPKGVEKPLYGLYELYRYVPNNKLVGLDLIVCESMLDALTCWCYGAYAVALNGLGDNLQFEQLRMLPCRHLILATDNDSAGLEARSRIRNNVAGKIISEYVLPMGKKDINELSKEEFYSLLEVF